MEEYADMAFLATSIPAFGYGCPVFMQSDIVNFQRQGWRAEEILAGLAAVLPKNLNRGRAGRLVASKSNAKGRLGSLNMLSSY